MADSFVSRFGCYTIIWDTTRPRADRTPQARRGVRAVLASHDDAAGSGLACSVPSAAGRSKTTLASARTAPLQSLLSLPLRLRHRAPPYGNSVRSNWSRPAKASAVCTALGRSTASWPSRAVPPGVGPSMRLPRWPTATLTSDLAWRFARSPTDSCATVGSRSPAPRLPRVCNFLGFNVALGLVRRVGSTVSPLQAESDGAQVRRTRGGLTHERTAGNLHGHKTPGSRRGSGGIRARRALISPAAHHATQIRIEAPVERLTGTSNKLAVARSCPPFS